MHLVQTSPDIALHNVRSGALGALLEGLIDYAGLFPPAGLGMDSATRNYASYRTSGTQWMLGRFIVPASRLAEFDQALLLLEDDRTEWQLSALIGGDAASDVTRILDFNSRHASDSKSQAIVSAIEVKAGTPDGVRRLDQAIPSNVPTYFEIPISDPARDCIAAISDCGRNAKIRLGGDVPELIPPVEQVAEFLHLCAKAKVPFKATAGLHHPIRSVHKLTYADDSPIGTMHGFFNVFLAASFLREGMDVSEAAELLLETSDAAFEFHGDDVCWRSNRLTRAQIAGSRSKFAMSFGSCSFTEPVDDLHRLFPA